jgi:Fe-S-cluster containining protein
LSNYSPEILNALKQFYTALDFHIHSIEEKNSSRINCKKGCFSCCKDDLEVFGLEAEYIRSTQSGFLKGNSPAPTGACAFLDHEGACRIYDSRPFVCRTHGVPIKYLQEDEEGEFELRDICPLNEKGEPIEELPNEKIFNNTSWEEKLVLLQMMADKGQMHRESLRDLFTKGEI